MPEHFEEADFEINFPESEDVFPSAIDNENFLDAVLFNKISESILGIEGYLIDHKSNIEGGGGLGALPATVTAINEDPVSSSVPEAAMDSATVQTTPATVTSP